MTRKLSGLVAAAMMMATIILLAVPAIGASFALQKTSPLLTTAFHRPRASQQAWHILRGGAADVLEEEEDEYDFEDEEEDEYDEEEEEEVEEDEALAKSALKATKKAQAKKTAATKKAVSSAMSKKKKSRKSILQLLRVPYIIRASLNPFTLIAMTKGYFGSLFSLNYLEEDSSQGLRSALEEKAKKEGSAGGKRKGKRTMRPGQAKTLSDLPQLNT